MKRDREPSPGVVPEDERDTLDQARRHLDAALDLLEHCGKDIAAAHVSLGRALLGT